MYHRHERPLSDQERGRLRDQLRLAHDFRLLGVISLVTVVVVDGVVGVFLYLHSDVIHFTPTLVVEAIFAAGFTHLIGLGLANRFRAEWRDYRRAQQQLADGYAVVEQIEARAYLELRADSGER